MRANPIALILCVFLHITLQAQESSPHPLYLRSGIVSLTPNITAEKVEAFNQAAARSVNKSFAVIRFEKIPTEEQRRQLSLNGIELLEYIPDNAYTVTISGALQIEALLNSGAKAIGELTPVQKMQPELAAGQFPHWAVKAAGAVDVWISFPRTFGAEEVRTSLLEKGWEILSLEYSRYRIISIRIPVTKLEELASLPFVEYVQAQPAADKELNTNSASLSKANLLKAPLAVGGKNLTGDGVTVGVGDNGDPQTHIDFAGRLINRSAAGPAAHASHVHGTVAGGGILQEVYAGYAPKATLVSQYFSGIIKNAPAYVQDHGMMITNNSYGSVENDCAYNGLYDLSARILDQQAFDLPELLHVFAAGNNGINNCSPYPVTFKTVLGGYQAAKNVLTVGATDAKGNASNFSSRGPVKDGRLKPEITSQGQFVLSTWTNNQYSSNNGTSMAAPGAAGGLALLVEQYRDANSGANPKNGLLKALISNGGADKGNAGPDYTYGFGNMNLLRSSAMIENSSYFNTTVTQGDDNLETISVPANTAQLKVLLYWSDPPAAVMASKTLVNDLDLEVTGPGGTVLPLRPDTVFANVNQPAVTGADHHNNIEQVVINNPAAGDYDLRVIGTLIAQNPSQEYFLVYDIIPQSLILTNPVGGESFVPTISSFGVDTVYIQWDAYGNSGGDYTLEFTSDGVNWSFLNDGNPAPSSQRNYAWVVPGVPTDLARIRITQSVTGFTQTSLPFVITASPFDSLTPVQCEGYIQLGWRNVPGATDYEVFMLQGNEMTPVATTTALNYTFSGLSKDSTYRVAVRPRINGNPGRRAPAITRRPNTGTCAGSISDNDIKIDTILSPGSSGRLFTSSELSNSVPVTIRIKNLDNAVSSEAIDVSYSVNGGIPVTATIPVPAATIAAGGSINYTFPLNADLSTVDTYNIVVTATKASDPVTANNTLSKRVKQLDNQPIMPAQLPWTDNFETTADQTVIINQMGLEGSDRYDFSKNASNGRLRTFINSGMAYSGNRAVTLDLSLYSADSIVNVLTGTFNLSAFNAAMDDIRLDFRYKNHGQQFDTSGNNKVWIRGSEADPWIAVYDLFDNQLPAEGLYKLSSSIQLADSLAAHGQNFGPGFQVRWGQRGRFMAADDNYAAGYTFDDIRIYRAVDDIQLVSIDTPQVVSCNFNSIVPVKITVRNTSDVNVSAVPVTLRVNGTIVATENIPSIPANDTVHYLFNPGVADLSVPGNHLVEAWVDYATDNVPENDTALVNVRSLPLISSFPYLEDFETGTNDWYTHADTNSTWQLGTPVSAKINRAASGVTAWKTNKAGYYNSMEHSYLYSPCFNLSGLTNPMLSFSLALDIEECDAELCDGAWMEYSDDGGITWNKLGVMGQGTNWYNKNYSGNYVWSAEDYTRWHVATIPLPTVNNSGIRLRFVFKSDPALIKDGIAIDDIHIYDNLYGIYEGTGESPLVNQSSVSGTGWIDFIETGTNKLIASINPNGQTLGSTDVQSFVNTGPVRINSDQYYHDRNITIKPATVNLADSATVRFYFLDSETEALLNATGCSYCYKPSMAYELGVTKYSDADDTKENGTLADNTPGNYIFINTAGRKLVPFDKGYYAEFKVKDFSEFWLNNGGFDYNQPLPVTLLSFTAKKKGSTNDVLVEWVTASESNTSHFEIELAKGNTGWQQNQFVKIGEVSSVGNSSTGQQYSFTDIETNKSGIRYYRLKMVDIDGQYTYSAIRPVLFDQEIQWQVSPNPSSGLFHLTCQAEAGAAISLRAIDANGREVYRQKHIGTGFVQRLEVDLSKGLSRGIYLLEAVTGSKRQVFNLVKQ